MFIKKPGPAAIFGVALVLTTVYMCATDAHAQNDKSVPAGTTLDNLMTAYDGEINAHVRYLAFAKKANKEGYDIAASLFRAAAAAEVVHYERHAELITKLGGTPQATIETSVVKSTRENLEAAFKSETYEKDVMYPEFLKKAKDENVKDAIDVFEDAAAAEAVHAQLYANMLNNLKLSKGLLKDFFVCPVCGNIVDALTSVMCPICATDTKKFRMIN